MRRETACFSIYRSTTLLGSRNVMTSRLGRWTFDQPCWSLHGVIHSTKFVLQICAQEFAEDMVRSACASCVICTVVEVEMPMGFDLVTTNMSF